MANYDQLISRIQNNSEQDQIDSFRKLFDLAINDQHHFRKYVIRLLTLITSIMPNLTNQTLKLLCLQLLSEIVNVYKPFAPKEQFQFSSIVPCLCDEKIEIRKSSHLMIFNFVKNYQELDQILRSYDEIGRSNDHPWKLTQKILHSFQSLMISEPMCVKYTKNYQDVDRFLDFVFEKDSSENMLIKKASNQALTSFVKNKFVPDIIQNLDKNITNKLLDHSKKVGYYVLEEKVGEIRKDKEEKGLEHIEIRNSIGKKEVGKKDGTKSFFKEKVDEAEYKTSEFRMLSPEKSVIKEEEKQEMVNQEMQTQTYLMEELVQKIRSNQLWNVKCQGIVKIYQLISNTRPQTFSHLLVERVIDLSSNIHFKIRLFSLKVLQSIITLSKQTFYNFEKKLLPILADKLCDSKSGIRRLAADMLKYVITIQRQSQVITTLLEKIQTAASTISKEEILSLLEQIFQNTENKEIKSSKTLAIDRIADLLKNDNWSFTLKVTKSIMKIMNFFSITELKNILKSQQYEIVLKAITIDNQQHKKANSTIKSKRQHLEKQQENSRNIINQPNESRSNNKNNNLKPYKRSQDYPFVQPKSANQRSDSLIQNNNKLKILKTKQKQINNLSSIIDEKRHNTLYQQKRQPENSNDKKPHPTPQKLYLDSKSTIDNENKRTNKIYNLHQTQTKQHPEQPKTKSFTIKNRSQLKIQTNFQQKGNLLNPEDSLSIDRYTKATSYSINKVPSKPIQKFKQQLESLDYKQITWVKKEELEPFLKVDKNFKRILMNLQNEINWKLQFEALNDLRRVFKFHISDCKNLEENFSLIVNMLLQIIDSKKSSLSKNGMIALSEMCQSLKKRLDPYLQSILNKLIKKGYDTNDFIAEEAKLCISSICQVCSSKFIFPIIFQHSKSKIPQIRVIVAKMIDNLVVKQKHQLLEFLKENARVVNVLGEFIEDSNEEVRRISQRIIQYLEGYINSPEIERMCQGNLGEGATGKIKKVLEKKKVESQNRK